MAFGFSRNSPSYDKTSDFDRPPKPPPEPDFIGEALGCPYRYTTGEMIYGIEKAPGIRYPFERIYHTKPIKVLADLFEPWAPEPPANEWYSVDLERLQTRFWTKQIEKSEKRAAAVRKYNEANPDAKYGYLATWRTQFVFSKDDVETALAGGTVALIPLTQ